MRYYIGEREANNMGKTFTEEDIGQTFIECMDSFDSHRYQNLERERPKKERAKKKEKGKAKASNRGTPWVMFM